MSTCLVDWQHMPQLISKSKFILIQVFEQEAACATEQSEIYVFV